MPQIIGVLFALGVVVTLGAYLAMVAVAAIALSLLPVLITSALVGAAMRAHRYHWIEQWARQRISSGQGVTLVSGADGLRWQVDPGRPRDWPINNVIHVAMAGCLALLAGQYAIIDAEMLVRVQSGDPFTLFLIFWGSLGLSGVGCFFAVSRIAKRLRSGIAHVLGESMSAALEGRMGDLRTIAKTLADLEDSYAAELAGLEIDAISGAERTTSRLIAVAYAEGLERARAMADQIRSELSTDFDQLRDAKRLLTKLLADFRAAKNAVYANTSSVLLADLDQIQNALDAKALEALIESRQWGDLFECLQEMSENVASIRALAAGSTIEPEREAETMPSTVDDAYRVLNVPPTATDEAVRRAWKALAVAWHDDTGATGGTEKLKAINVAFDIIRKARGMSR